MSRDNDREAILRRLKKLRAHADSAAALGSEKEAAAFAEMLQKMVAEHHVDSAELAAEDQDELDPFDRVKPNYAKFGVKVRRTHVEWLQTLAYTIAQAHYCVLLVVKGTSVAVFAGRRSNAEAAADVYLKLVVLAEQIADKEYVEYFHQCRKGGDVAKARGFRHSFLVGFCARIGVRYAQYLKDLQAYYAHDKKALATLGSARSKVHEWLDLNGVTVSNTEHKHRGATHRDGFHKGVDLANATDLSGHRRLH